MKSDAIFIPECPLVERVLMLKEHISAIEIIPGDDGSARLGALAELPKGSALEVCGDGFNGRTVKARCDGRFYFIYLQDLESPNAIDHALAKPAEA